MREKFISNLALVLILNIIIKPFYILGIDAEILKITEQSEPGSYGSYFSLLSLSFVFNILLDMGVNTFNTRNIAQNNNLFYKHFSGILTLKVFLGLIYLVVIMIIGYLFSYEIKELKWLFFIAVNQVLIALILFFRSNLSGLLMFRQDSLISVTDRTLLILFCGYFLWLKTTHQVISIDFFIFSQTLAYFLTASIAFILLINKSGQFNFSWNLKLSISIIKKSIPYALLIFLMSIYYYADVVMIERITGDIEAATYAHGYRFFMAFNMIGVLFAGLLLPIFSKMIKDKIDISEMTWLSFKIIFVCAIILGLTIWFFKTDVIKWRYDLYGSSLAHSSDTFGWLLISFIAVSFNYIFGTLLTANGNLKPMNILALSAVTINIAINFILIPKFGSTGAAFASMITQFFSLIIQLFLCYKFFPSRLKILPFLRLGIFLIVFISSVWLIKENFNLLWFSKILISAFIGLTLSFLFKIIGIKELSIFIKKSKN